MTILQPIAKSPSSKAPPHTHASAYQHLAFNQVGHSVMSTTTLKFRQAKELLSMRIQHWLLKRERKRYQGNIPSRQLARISN